MPLTTEQAAAKVTDLLTRRGERCNIVRHGGSGKDDAGDTISAAPATVAADVPILVYRASEPVAVRTVGRGMQTADLLASLPVDTAPILETDELHITGPNARVLEVVGEPPDTVDRLVMRTLYVRHRR